MINKIDYNISQMFHKLYVWGGEIANTFMKGISFIAEAGILFLLIGFICVLFKHSRKIGATILLAVALGFLFTNLILKNAIGRARPFENMTSDYYKWWLDAGGTHESGYSFPSGHTTATTAFAVALFLTTNKRYSWPILFLPIAMACSRIYLMVHFFTDCVGGLVVGSLCATIAYIIVVLIYRSKVKFFVWAKELELFKAKKKASNDVDNIAQPASSKEECSDYIYVTETEEKASLGNSEDASETTQDK